jgi:hypothetical protein
MNPRWFASFVSVVLVISIFGHPQTSPPQSPDKYDYSHEAAIVEEMSTKIVFDDDGGSSHWRRHGTRWAG